MGTRKLLLFFLILSFAACSGGNLVREGADNSNIRSEIPSKVEVSEENPPPPPPSSPGAEGAPEGNGPSLAPSGFVRAPSFLDSGALGEKLTLAKDSPTDAVAIQQKACFGKYDACRASIATDPDAVEKERACKSAYNGCLAEKTEEEKCNDVYSGCVGSTAGKPDQVEAQRVCVKTREYCLASKVYPACCDNTYRTCLGAVPPGDSAVEAQRACVSSYNQCMARYYCE